MKYELLVRQWEYDVQIVTSAAALQRWISIGYWETRTPIINPGYANASVWFCEAVCADWLHPGSAATEHSAQLMLTIIIWMNSYSNLATVTVRTI